MILISAEEAMIDNVSGTPMLTTLVANTNGFNSKTGSSYNSHNNILILKLVVISPLITTTRGKILNVNTGDYRFLAPGIS